VSRACQGKDEHDGKAALHIRKRCTYHKLVTKSAFSNEKQKITRGKPISMNTFLL